MPDTLVYAYHVLVNKLTTFSDVVTRKSGSVLLSHVLYCSVDKIGHYSAEINNEIYINHNGKLHVMGCDRSGIARILISR